jgi:hypothetical protein
MKEKQQAYCSLKLQTRCGQFTALAWADLRPRFGRAPYDTDTCPAESEPTEARCHDGAAVELIENGLPAPSTQRRELAALAARLGEWPKTDAAPTAAVKMATHSTPAIVKCPHKWQHSEKQQTTLKKSSPARRAARRRRTSIASYLSIGAQI